MKIEIFKLLKKYYYFVFVLIFIIIISLFAFEAKADDEKANEKIEVVKTDESTKKEEEQKLPKFYFVEIKGAVNNPGVYKMDESARVINVIEAAGGTSENANIDVINLSKKINDEMVIIIYTNDEIEALRKNSEENSKYEIVEKECVCPDSVNSACIEPSDSGLDNKNGNDLKNTNDQKIENEGDKKEKISINVASLEELMTINGIGESKAKAIIEYRDLNGAYQSIDDVKNVSGIGDALFEKIKEFITV